MTRCDTVVVVAVVGAVVGVVVGVVGVAAWVEHIAAVGTVAEAELLDSVAEFVGATVSLAQS